MQANGPLYCSVSIINFERVRPTGAACLSGFGRRIGGITLLVHIKAILNKVKGSFGSLGITRKL